MTESVQRGTPASLENDGRSNSYKSMISIPYRQFGCSVFGNWNLDGSCMLRACGAVLHGAKPIDVPLSRK